MVGSRRAASLLGVVPLAVVLLTAGGASAQQLELKRTVPPVAWTGCAVPASPASPTAEQRQQAAALAAEATQAALLGDEEAAHRLLERAVALDPTSPDLAYRLAHALEQLDRPRDAVEEYCRYVALDPDAPDAGEIRERLPALAARAGFAVNAAAAEAFATGIAHFDAGRLPEADVAFGLAGRSEAGWGAPLYNRAVVRFALDREEPALEDLREYLERSPGATDFHRVLDIIVSYHEGAGPRYSPGAAFATGLLVPGLGHFTTGRPAMGAFVLASAGGAIAAGLGVRRVEIQCLAPVEGGECPPDQIQGRTIERPYQTAGIAGAAAIAFLGALDAYRGARSRNAARRALPGLDLPGGATVRPPAAVPDGNRVRLDLLRLQF